MTKLQNTSWGSVEWLRTADGGFGLSCGIVTLDPHAKQEEHIHYESEQICYVLEGQGRVSVNGKVREFGPGTTILMPANCRNFFENTGSRPVRQLLITSAVASKDPDLDGPAGDPLLPLPDGRMRTGHPLADSVIEWLNGHFAESDGTQELADANHTSPANLCRVFRRETGETVSGYRNRIRIRHAMDLAADPAVPLSTIGALCGYASENNFYRQFRRITGKTPGEYRRSVRTGEFIFR